MRNDDAKGTKKEKESLLDTAHSNNKEQSNAKSTTKDPMASLTKDTSIKPTSFSSAIEPYPLIMKIKSKPAATQKDGKQKTKDEKTQTANRGREHLDTTQASVLQELSQIPTLSQLQPGTPATDLDEITTESVDEEARKKEEKDEELKYGAKHVIMLFVPVSVCMLFVVVIMNTVPYYGEQATKPGFVMFDSSRSEGEGQEVDAGTEVWMTLVNVAAILGFIILMTVVLVILYIKRCYKVIHGWLIVSTVMILTVMTFIFLLHLFKSLNVPLDYITVAICLYNFAGVGCVAIHWKAPLRIQQAYLVFFSGLSALIFISLLPEWTAWVVLGMLAIWDLVAVLWSRGPLRMLVETAQERGDPIFPALIYTSTVLFDFVMMADTSSVLDEPPSSANADVAAPRVKEGKKVKEDKEERGIKLGLGDFVFYSLLVGKASFGGDWNTTIACFTAILVGLALTLILLAVIKKALPALPISIAFGLVFYFCTKLVIRPFTARLSEYQLFI